MEARKKPQTMINDKLNAPKFNLALKTQKIPQVSDNTVLNIALAQVPLEDSKFKGPILIIKSL